MLLSVNSLGAVLMSLQLLCRGDDYMGVDSLLAAVIQSPDVNLCLTETGATRGPLEEALKQVGML